MNASDHPTGASVPDRASFIERSPDSLPAHTSVLIRLVVVLTLLVAGFSATGAAQSGTPDNSTAVGSGILENPCVDEDLPTPIKRIGNLLAWIVRIGISLGIGIAVINGIRSGVLYQIGTPPAVEKSRKILIDTGIGVTIILLSSAAVRFMAQVLCGGAGL